MIAICLAGWLGVRSRGGFGRRRQTGKVGSRGLAAAGEETVKGKGSHAFAVDEKQSDRSSAGAAPSCKALFTRPKHAAAIGPSPGAFPALFGKGARDNSSSTSTLVGQEPICWSVTVAPVFSFLDSGVYLLISDHESRGHLTLFPASPRAAQRSAAQRTRNTPPSPARSRAHLTNLRS
ncbi:hypothetical protein CCHR01_12594 [Colletotrichum chrysophilum]|uniref:Uncharacterized protein n=1 Tax=Colletotrichum chrysophilum TaxID=1836956 RepID=A0AAD9AFW3_9PEZI|nr:hypothetical protein CCHR01_12594 [Colletotrichum chrysophilum]